MSGASTHHLPKVGGTIREMSHSVSSPQPADASPDATRPFGTIRRDALDRWRTERVDAHGVAWECRWQNASRSLARNCVTPGCTETHVSLYCSFNDAADQFVDLLTDERRGWTAATTRIGDCTPNAATFAGVRRRIER
jgi:hypothetical protein